MKIVTLDEKTFDEFSNAHKYRNMYQTSSYGRLMKKNGFEVDYLGFMNNQNELIGASLILYKDTFLNYKYAYAPRGFLIDYTDIDLVKDISDKLRKFLYRNNFIFLRIDPPILCSERNKVGDIISYNPDIDGILSILENCGYQHNGFNLFFENKKPRWNAVVKLHTNNSRLFNGFDKQVRNKIRKADKLGVVVYKATKEDLPIFYEFVKKKHYRTLEYYQQLMEEFGDNAELYLAKIDAFKYVQKSKEAYEKVEEENEKLTLMIQNRDFDEKDLQHIIGKKMESDKILGMEQANLNRSTKMYQTTPEGIVIGGAIVIKQEERVDLLIEGFNEEYSSFNCNYYLKWELIQKFNKENYQYFNLNAIVGEFKNKNKYSGLNEMKLGFGSSAVEYIGEFNYIINPIAYKLYLNKNQKN